MTVVSILSVFCGATQSATPKLPHGQILDCDLGFVQKSTARKKNSSHCRSATSIGIHHRLIRKIPPTGAQNPNGNPRQSDLAIAVPDEGSKRIDIVLVPARERWAVLNDVPSCPSDALFVERPRHFIVGA